MPQDTGTEEVERYALSRQRRWVDTATRHVVALGGVAVIAAIALIFFYLLWVVAPIFGAAGIVDGKAHALEAGRSLYLDVSENDEFGLRITSRGNAAFIDLRDGGIRHALDFERGLDTVKAVYPSTATYALLDENNHLNLVEATYPVSFADNQRVITPRLDYLFGSDWLSLGELADFDVHYDGQALSLVSLVGRVLQIDRYRDAIPGFELEAPRSRSVELAQDYERVLFGSRGNWIFLVNATGTVALLEVSRTGTVKTLDRVRVVAEDAQLLAVELLLGRYSLLVADDQQQITQWFPVRGESGVRLEAVRSFSFPANIVQIIPEPRRKGYAAIDEQGVVHLLYSTSARQLASHPLRDAAVQAANISPRSDTLLTVNPGGLVHRYRLENEHPEISWAVLWSKIFYEGYAAPVHSWQSSSADNDFEPKFSLTPLLFGTLKAALYAMLFAVPIAIMGALYTAYFMAPAMRRIVKPGIEIMAALPTVVLGFLAGLWLAPLVEANLPAVAAIMIGLPVGIALISLLWLILPDSLTKASAGWYGLLMVPAIVLIMVTAFHFSPAMESALFGGDARAWLLEHLGLEYDQRNALVVGLAMGLAVIPIIFSIAEDAVYGVPAHLIHGSLALGATRWQTLIRVVILTASPGIFSAVMIGLGRAVGETMIVLMATGNTPLMDLNIFEGMRTLAANIAVELPESEVDSSHYRILFLTAFVLFVITFVFNTIAELVRQRLRIRYGSL